MVPHVRAKLHFADDVFRESGSNGIHVDALFGLQTEPSYVQLSGHFAIFETSNVRTTCGLMINLYAAKKRIVKTIVNATLLKYSILSLIQGKEWILLDMY